MGRAFCSVQGLHAGEDEDEDIELLTVGPAPELTFDDKVVAFINRADPRGDGNDELTALAAEYLQVIPCLPRLAPRCATRAAIALQQSKGNVDAALAAYFRDRDEVKIAESLYARAHTLRTLALLVHVPVHTYMCTHAKHMQPYNTRTLHRTQREVARSSACSGARSPRPGCARAAEIARSYVHEWVCVCMHVCLSAWMSAWMYTRRRYTCLPVLARCMGPPAVIVRRAGREAQAGPGGVRSSAGAFVE
jgi:hypothetical protein